MELPSQFAALGKLPWFPEKSGGIYYYEKHCTRVWKTFYKYDHWNVSEIIVEKNPSSFNAFLGFVEQVIDYIKIKNFLLVLC